MHMRDHRGRKRLSEAKDYQILYGGGICHNCHVSSPDVFAIFGLMDTDWSVYTL